MSGKDDEFERLRAGLQAGAPVSDPATRAAALRRAMESFDQAQGTAAGLRSSKDRPKGAGILAGVFVMFERLTSRAVLGATASVAVLAIAAYVVTDPKIVPDRPIMPEFVQGKQAAPAAIEQAPVVATEAVTAEAPQADMLAAPPVAMPAPEPATRRARSEAMGGAAQRQMSLPATAAAPPVMQEIANDRFAAFDPNPLKVAAEQPVSTFSVDVDTAAWSWLRSSLRMGVRPDPAAIRIEEMVNYFPYDYTAPAGDVPFSTAVSVFQTPWNAGTQLVRIGLQGKLPETAARPPLNLVFLIDTSGSMQGPDRIGLLKSAFGMLLGTLRPEDKVAIVAYAGSAGEVLAPTPAAERGAIMAALDGLVAGGSTAGGAGLELAYGIAARMAGEGSVNRVVLATDGDFNVGLATPDALKEFVADRRKSGVYLSVLGFGRGNMNDALMQALAQNGNGQAAYIDSAEEARKVLVDQAAGALFPIAGDVKIQVEWNPAVVAEYRLIGYETRALAREDFANDKVDAGEIGAGHQVTALYEVTPVDSAARLTDPLRYGAAAGEAAKAGEAGWLRLRYKLPGQEVSALIEAPIPATGAEADADARFAAAIAGFGQLLSGGKYLGDWGYDAAIALAESARGADRFGYRAEAISLMRVAQSLLR